MEKQNETVLSTLVVAADVNNYVAGYKNVVSTTVKFWYTYKWVKQLLN